MRGGRDGNGEMRVYADCQITSHLERLTAVEKELAGLKAGMAGREDVGKIRGEMRKMHVSDSLCGAFDPNCQCGCMC